MSNHTAVPLFFHPTSILFIDDDNVWLNSLILKMESYFSCFESDSSAKGYQMMLEKTYQLDQLSANFEEINGEFQDQSVGVVDYQKMIEELRTKGYKQKVTTVVIDYNMPELDGLSFCKKAREENIAVKFILLTGAADSKIAVQAFNDGIIDCYIEKDDIKMAEKLTHNINTLSRKQFIEIGEHLIRLPYEQTTHLSDPVFINFFDNILRDNKINEFYFFSDSGSFLLVDQQGKEKILLIKTPKDFDMASDIALDNGISGKLVDAIKNYEQYPFTVNDDAHLSLSKNQWEDAMLLMNQIPEKNIFYALKAVNRL